MGSFLSLFGIIILLHHWMKSHAFPKSNNFILSDEIASWSLIFALIFYLLIKINNTTHNLEVMLW